MDKYNNRNLSFFNNKQNNKLFCFYWFRQLNQMIPSKNFSLTRFKKWWAISATCKSNKEFDMLLETLVTAESIKQQRSTNKKGMEVIASNMYITIYEITMNLQITSFIIKKYLNSHVFSFLKVLLITAFYILCDRDKLCIWPKSDIKKSVWTTTPRGTVDQELKL